MLLDEIVKQTMFSEMKEYLLENQKNTKEEKEIIDSLYLLEFILSVLSVNKDEVRLSHTIRNDGFTRLDYKKIVDFLEEYGLVDVY